MKRTNPLKYVAALALVAVAAMACNSSYTPKPKGYFAIDFPEKQYRSFDQHGYPYTFEYPVYAVISKDTSFFGDKPENPWWINIDVPQFAGRIYISYKEITRKDQIYALAEDAYKMATKQHMEISTGIDQLPLKTQNGVEGLFYSLKGNTATANQFFLTDSTRHFLRGALYFDAAPNEDSLGIVNEFLKKDLDHLINTLKFR
jgi:gliding motility-associated lipoprotein GldD